MPYQEAINYKNHDFNTTAVLINKVHTAQSLEMIEVTRAKEKITVTEVASGDAIFNKSSSKVGNIKIQCLEGSPTNDVMWALEDSEASFPVAVSDSNAPNLDVKSAMCQINKPPIERGGEAKLVEWNMMCTYLNMKGGSYRLESA